ncbi:exonuclease 1-like protein [Vairimorpha necatrix]|uniref:Exonuclease 1-like protein n=1 Tax=Vairimorpha necatrix TaxID=6039 RepID=A0AAX4JCM9_9MICR
MPIRGIETIKKSSLNTWIAKAQVSVLKDSILAIDGFWFLRKYVVTGNMSDFFISKCDERFLAPVLRLIKMSNLSKIQILFVWDGLDFEKPISNSKTTDFDKLKTGFEAYKKNEEKICNQNWKHLLDFEDVVSPINKLLKQFGHDAVRAPYSATAQIAYFLQNNMCNYGFCKSDALIFEGVEKIITDFHLENSEHFMFTAFNKKNFMKAFELTNQNFRILAFALGCEFCPTIPEYADNFIPENIITIVKTRDFDNYLEELSKNNPIYLKYINSFYTAFVLIDFHPVMKEEGKVSFFKNSEVVPSDFTNIFGKRLSDKFYKLLFNCKNIVKILEKIKKNEVKFLEKNISYKLLTNQNPDKSDLQTLLVKDLKISDKIPKSIQVLYYYLITENIVKEKCLDKLICTSNLEENMIMSQNVPEKDFDYSQIEFVYKCNKIIRQLKETKEVYEIVSPTGDTNDLNFDFNIFLFPILYYNKNKENLNDNGTKYLLNFIEGIKDHIELNAEINESYKKTFQDIK